MALATVPISQFEFGIAILRAAGIDRFSKFLEITPGLLGSVFFLENPEVNFLLGALRAQKTLETTHRFWTF